MLTRTWRGDIYVTWVDGFVLAQDGTIEALVAAKLNGPDIAVVSANVVNHIVLGEVQSHIGALLPFAPNVDPKIWCDPDLTKQQCSEKELRWTPCQGSECDWKIVLTTEGKPAALDNQTVRFVSKRHTI